MPLRHFSFIKRSFSIAAARHGPISPFYNVCVPDLSASLESVTRAQQAFSASIPKGSGLLEFLRSTGLWEYVSFRLCHTSNALEGNTLSEGEVLNLLRSRTPSSSMWEDQEDIMCHARGLEHLASLAIRESVPQDVLKTNRAITLRDLLQTHAMSIPAGKYNVPGMFRDGVRAAASRAADGSSSILVYPSPSIAADETMELVRWVADNEGSLHPVALAAVAHYNLVRAHPFGDGNGRMGRLLMNFLLLRSGYLPSIIRLEDKRSYLAALHAADHERTLSPLIKLVAEGTLRCISDCSMEELK